VTSYKALYDDARACDRWNRLHPQEARRVPYVEQSLADHAAPVVAASDYVRSVGLSLSPWVPCHYTVLGTDGFGRSEDRASLRRFFEVDAENVALAALDSLAAQGAYPKAKLSAAIAELGLDPDKPNPASV
jgi:pyruvate dehydrogenase E1 component